MPCCRSDPPPLAMPLLQAALGVPSLTAPPDKRTLLINRWCQPSLSVVDMRPGTAAPTPLSSFPSTSQRNHNGTTNANGTAASCLTCTAAGGHTGSTSNGVPSASPGYHSTGTGGPNMHGGLQYTNAAGQGIGADAGSCYRFGPTRFSVIPKSAEGKVSIRFVPHQDADTLVTLLRWVARAF